jgi:hypothetical protein
MLLDSSRSVYTIEFRSGDGASYDIFDYSRTQQTGVIYVSRNTGYRY